MTEVKYPDVVVDLGNLSGPEGNAFAVMGNVQRAMRAAGKSHEEVEAYMNEAMSGDYNNLLSVTRKTVSVVQRVYRYVIDEGDEDDDLYADSDWDRD